MELDFTAVAFEWRGPAPFVFVELPGEAVEALRTISAVASYGWGCITVVATVGESTWSTSLMPYRGGYVLPLKAVIRKAEGIALDDLVAVRLTVPL